MPESFEVKDGLIQPTEVVVDGSAEIVDWQERAVESPSRAPTVERPEPVEPERRPRTGLLLAGAGVTVGLVALVSILYATSDDAVTAHCVGEDNMLAENENLCDEDYVRGLGGYYDSGFFYVPLAGQYHYNYGGSLGADRRVSGGTLEAPPADTPVKTTSGRTVKRGGFGINGGTSGGS